MRRLTETKIILVTRPTRVAELKRRYSTKSQAAFYVKHLGQDFSDYEREDSGYMEAVRKTRLSLDQLGRVQMIDRSFLPNFVFGPEDVVVVLGQDGLVANTVKYLDGQPVVGVNPDPDRWDGQLLPFRIRDLSLVMPEVVRRRRPIKSATMAKATLNTGQSLLGVNDIFLGPRTHGSARYTITIDGRTERQSSSGVIVSTGVGSTGWLKSLLTGATGIARAVTSTSSANPPPVPSPGKPAHRMGPASEPPAGAVPSEFAWDADFLRFTVREPFPTKSTQCGIVFGSITLKQPLILVSEMPENGVIFSDGLEQDFLEFRSGTRAILGIAEKRGCLVV